MLNIQPNSKVMNEFVDGINNEIEKFVEVKTKEIIKNTKTLKNKFEEYNSIEKDMDRVSNISYMIYFFENIFVISEEIDSHKRQMFYFLNNLYNEKFEKFLNLFSTVSKLKIKYTEICRLNYQIKE